MRIRGLIPTIAALALVPGSAIAVGSISDGDVTFSYTDFGQGFHNTTNADYTIAGGDDQIFETWWFFRVSGDGRETAFSAPDTEDYSLGNYARLGWSDVGGRGLFDATLNVAVLDPGVGGNLFQELNITALSDVTLEVFHYTDFDVAGTFDDDSATLDSAGPDVQMTVTDPGGTFVPFVGYGADAFKVAPYDLGFPLQDVLRDLTDGGQDDFDDSGLSLSGDDFAGGFQWSISLLAGQTTSVMSQWGVDAILQPASMMPVPEPGTAVLLGIGLLGLGLHGRRIRKLRDRAMR